MDLPVPTSGGFHTHLQSLPPHSGLKRLNTAPRCVSRTSVWQRARQKNTLLMSTGGCWGATLKPSNVTSAPTCVNIGHKRVDPNYVKKQVKSKNQGFLPVSNRIVRHERNKAIMAKVKALSLVCEWCGYSSGSESYYFTLNNCDWHNRMHRSSDGCYDYIILLKLHRYSVQKPTKARQGQTAKALQPIAQRTIGFKCLIWQYRQSWQGLA